jgi:D,D-heptose 1,7-bisphosphate phosphatase
VEKERRLGDPARLIADSALAERVLGFKQSKNNIKTMISSAWEWEKKHSTFLRKAIFLDRDGTLNEDPGYLSDPGQLKLLPQVGESLALLKACGYLLVVISNQSGVGRGLIEHASLSLIHERLDQLLSPWNVKIDRYEFCIHHPDDECECRKPKPKLILDVAQALKIDVAQSYMVGDRISDLEAGVAARCRGTVLVKTGRGANTAIELKKVQVAFIGDSLLDVAHWIQDQENVGF